VHTLFQDVALLPGLLSAKLLWADHLQNHAGDFVDPIQEWRVEVWDPADNSVLAELFSTNPGDLPLQGWTERMADLSPWIGQTIRLAFTQEDNLYFFNARLDEVRILGEVPLPVTLDIRPGVATNLVNPAGAGVLRVAILGSETFDVSDVNLATLTFGADGAATVSVHAGDVNGDGTLDLISDHATSAAGIVAGDTSACVNGVTQRGEPLRAGAPAAGTDVAPPEARARSHVAETPRDLGDAPRVQSEPEIIISTSPGIGGCRMRMNLRAVVRHARRDPGRSVRSPRECRPGHRACATAPPRRGWRCPRAGSERSRSWSPRPLRDGEGGSIGCRPLRTRGRDRGYGVAP
jgi:hypothetical protein